MRLHQLRAEEVLTSLHSSLQGLLPAEVLKRLQEFGPNLVEALPPVPLWRQLLSQLTGFFSVILWAAALLAFLVQWRDPTQDMAQVGWALIIVILVSAAFSYWQEARAERSLETLRRLLPQEVDVRRAGTVQRVPAEQLVPGDIVLLRAGDRVPADCRIIESFGVRVDSAVLTGESVPRSCDSALSGEGDFLQSRNLLFGGTSLVSGEATAVVYATGRRTQFGRIAQLVQTAGEEVSPLHREVRRLSRTIAILSVAVGLAFFAASRAFGIAPSHAAMFAIGVIVAMVPEGLLPTLTLALVLATQRMAKRKALIRYLPAVEALGCTSVICTDKTGTLTEGRMAVTEIVLGGECHSPSELERQPQLSERYRPFFLTARLCHESSGAELSLGTRRAGDSMEAALLELARRALPEEPPSQRLDEIAFDSVRMRLATLYSAPDGATLYCKGAPESVLPLCERWLIDGEVRILTTEDHLRITVLQEALASRGRRVLALAYRAARLPYERASLEHDLILAGLAGLEDPPRREVPDAIARCRAAGIKVIIVTGDHPLTALAVAREIGLIQSEHPTVITGEQLARSSAAQLQLALDAPEILFARVVAEQKMQIVQALKDKQHIVAVTGDGVNDAPALKSAHIGIAMGLTGTDVAKQAAAMVLLDDNFASIVNAVEEGRAVFENIRKFLTYILAHNVPELVPYLAFVLFNVPLALTPIQILSIDMGTDSLTALGLGVDPPARELMRRPPRDRGERLVDWSLAMRAYFFLGAIEAAAAMTVFFRILRHGGWQYGQEMPSSDPHYLQATTATLGAIIVMQIMNVYLCRSPKASVRWSGLRGNTLITAGVLLEVAIILLIVYTPWGQRLFGTAALPGWVWLSVVPFALAMLALEEARKWVARRTRDRRRPVQDRA